MIRFAIGGGSGEFHEQTRFLIKSIRQFVDQPYRITVYLPDEEYSEIPPEELQIYEQDDIDLVKGPYPLSDYPISIKQAALKAAEKEGDSEWYILLDSDTIFVNPIGELNSLVEPETSLLLCPEHGGWTYWAQAESEDDWMKVYSLIDTPFPGYTMQSSFDNTPIPPYWNSGVVATRRPIADEWLALIREIRDLFGRDLYYTDQIALPLLGSRYGVSRLPYSYNYPYFMHVRCPSDRRILHYDSLWHLGRILNPEIRNNLEQIGVLESKHVPRGLSRVKSIGRGIVVRVFREIVRRQLPRVK